LTGFASHGVTTFPLLSAPGALPVLGIALT
jgi:hypothetical protein